MALARCPAPGGAAELPHDPPARELGIGACLGRGTRAPGWYHWALIEVADPAAAESTEPQWLLIRRRISHGEYASDDSRTHRDQPIPLTRHEIRRLST